MKRTVKRLLGGAIALAAILAAVASMPGVDATTARSVRQSGEQAADAELPRVRALFEARLHQLEPRVSAAAGRQELTQILSLLRSADPTEGVLNTLRDGLTQEAWAASVRRDFPVIVVSLSDAPPDATPDLVLGARSEAVRAGPLIARARAQGLSSALIRVGDAVHAAGADAVTVPGRRPAVLLLARPVDAAMLAPERPGVAVALVLDGKTRAGGGEAAGLAFLDRFFERSGGLPSSTGDVSRRAALDDDLGWAGAGAPMGDGIWLWVLVSTGEAQAAAASTALKTRVAIGGGAALLAILALVLAFRGGSGGAVSEPTEEPRTAPRGTEPGLGATSARVSAGAVASHARVSGIAQTQAVAAPPPAPANQFGRYTLLDPLGEGGMARVFTAVTFGAEGFRRKFVVKRLRPELSGEQAVVAQFIDEAKLASTLVHSNIVPVFDFGKVGDEYFLATEYILGRDLARVVQRCRERRGESPATELLLYTVAEVLKALDYAHTRRQDDGRPMGIVHRDVSPSNVLVSARGEIKLFDFGIVKAEGRVTRTQHGVVKGNVSFMSPEQARGVDVDARADLFSLGLVLYYCATGEPLYQGGTTYELLVKAAGGPGPSEWARIHQLPAPLPALLQRALAIDPAQRFQSAAEFAQAIGALGVRVDAAAVAQLMNELFGDDFQEEEARFASTLPTTSPGYVPDDAGRTTRSRPS